MRIPIVAAFCAALGGGAVYLLALTALAQTVPPVSGETAKGKTLVDLNGMTLYVFDRDVRANRIAMPNAPSIGCP
jgi:predicted lipoprotein with Yx(FWY)xxD motif